MVKPQHLMAIFPVFIALSACGSSGSTPNEWVRGDWNHGNSRTFNGGMRTWPAYVRREQLQGLVVVMHGSVRGESVDFELLWLWRTRMDCWWLSCRAEWWLE